MRTAQPTPFYRSLIRRFLALIFRSIFRLVARIEIQGLENIPQLGPYTIVYNHVSLYESPFIVAFWPTSPEVIGAEEVWNRPGQAILARLWSGIPVKRGEVNRDAMGQALRILRNGKVLMIAPEGTRSHVPGLRQGKPGIVYLVERTQTLIVPVGVVGMTDEFIHQVFALKRPRVRMVIGKPFALPELEAVKLSPKEDRQAKADLIMGQIAGLLPHEYRGIYA